MNPHSVCWQLPSSAVVVFSGVWVSTHRPARGWRWCSVSSAPAPYFPLYFLHLFAVCLFSVWCLGKHVLQLTCGGKTTFLDQFSSSRNQDGRQGQQVTLPVLHLFLFIVCLHTKGSQKTTCRRQFSSSSMGSRDRTQVITHGKTFTPWDISMAQKGSFKQDQVLLKHSFNSNCP